MKTWRTKLDGAEFKIMRLQDAPIDNPVTDHPEAIVRYLRERLPGSLRYSTDPENLIVILLNARKRPIGFEIVSNGLVDTLLVAPLIVFRPAFLLNASGIILAHNHPSGDPAPSEADIKTTRDMVRAGQLLKIEVCDHIILGRATPERPKDFVSLRECGYFYN